jgi:hypothetical protein
VAGNQGVAFALISERIGSILSADFQDSARKEVTKMNSAFDLGLNDVMVDGLSEVRARDECAGRQALLFVVPGQFTILPHQSPSSGSYYGLAFRSSSAFRRPKRKILVGDELKGVPAIRKRYRRRPKAILCPYIGRQKTFGY